MAFADFQEKQKQKEKLEREISEKLSKNILTAMI